MLGISKHAKVLLAGTALTVIAVSQASAGGFAVREQSSSFLGMAFAGAAAGHDLSSGYWNPAAFANAEVGITTESHYAAIFANSKVSGQVVNTGANIPGAGGVAVNNALNVIARSINSGPNESSIDRPAFVSASYGAYRLNDKLVLGISMNAPFGLSTEPNQDAYTGRTHGLNSSLFTLNASPTLAYEIIDGVKVAAGVQLQYADLAFKFNTLRPNAAAFGGLANPGATANDIGNSEIDVTDEIGVGFTLGVLLQPAAGTSIGVGFRSKIEHNFEGELAIPGNAAVPVTADFELPEILTVSLSQALSSNMRLHATYEWTNWSRFDSIAINGTASADVVQGLLIAATAGAQGSRQDLTLEGGWEDGHFVSVGGEYDMNNQLTVRGGVAWEKSPVQSGEARLLQVPDNDRWWFSAGAAYKWSEMTTIDFAYTYIHVEEGDINRASLSAPPLVFQGQAETDVHIIGVSMKTKWGENGLQNFIGGLLGGGG